MVPVFHKKISYFSNVLLMIGCLVLLAGCQGNETRSYSKKELYGYYEKISTIVYEPVEKVFADGSSPKNAITKNEAQEIDNKLKILSADLVHNATQKELTKELLRLNERGIEFYQAIKNAKTTDYDQMIQLFSFLKAAQDIGDTYYDEEVPDSIVQPLKRITGGSIFSFTDEWSEDDYDFEEDDESYEEAETLYKNKQISIQDKIIHTPGFELTVNAAKVVSDEEGDPAVFIVFKMENISEDDYFSADSFYSLGTISQVTDKEELALEEVWLDENYLAEHPEEDQLLYNFYDFILGPGETMQFAVSYGLEDDQQEIQFVINPDQAEQPVGIIKLSINPTL
ncbi:DUF5067 domain-containing protein [Enterococcus massiliensis]|uniref:DUF5067 domain-containing protein n=1 Tax=Enterococcus massiliensis TaxID=1640685 RepID=UPI00065DBE75|nr:DUF5067 domain-containing protein [Enterococcus massiliensis]